MKTKTAMILMLLAILAAGASLDYRTEKQSVARLDFAQGTWASGVTAAVAKTMQVNGCCEQIAVAVNNNTGNRTATVTITDENGATLFTQAGIAEAATTTYFARSYKAVQDANFNPFLAVGTLTATLTPSGDPGASGMTVDVYLYLKP
jgi:hypothetical protein